MQGQVRKLGTVGVHDAKNSCSHDMRMKEGVVSTNVITVRATIPVSQ